MLGDNFFATGLFLFATMVPMVATAVCRLHDVDRSGWWILALLVPILGQILVLRMALWPGTPGSNRYGAGGTAPPADTAATG